MSNLKLGPCTLEGNFVRLEPLRKHHTHALLAAASKLDWEWMLRPLKTRVEIEQRISEGLKRERKGDEYAFAVVFRSGELVVGSTAYLEVSPPHRRTEIGSTWYSPEMWGTAVNPECKFLLLKHAFEDWNAVRVDFGTHAENVHSQRAILKLGAKFEGRLRNYGIMPDGSVRDSMLYSIIASEWPEVKARLLKRIKSFE